MQNSLHRIVSRLFLKRRHVLAEDRGTYVQRILNDTEFEMVTFEGERSIDEALRLFGSAVITALRQRVGDTVLRRRLESRECTLYLALSRDDGDLAGFYWALAATDQPLWHDKYEIHSGTALLFNALVLDGYRRRGVYSLLLAQAHNHLFSFPTLTRVITIVEAVNFASLQANRQFGLRSLEENHLIKLAGLNLLAIYRGASGLRIHWVLALARRFPDRYVP